MPVAKTDSNVFRLLLLTEGSHSPRTEGALQSGGTALKSSFRINKTFLSFLQLL